MVKKLGSLLVVLVLFVIVGISQVNAKTVNVNVKVEGPDQTLMLNTNVAVEPTDISSIVGVYPGTPINWTTTPDGNPYAIQALVKALQAKGYDPSNSNILSSGYGTYLLKILNQGSTSDGSWMFAVNNQMAEVGINQKTVKDGDQITFYYLSDWLEVNYNFFDKESLTVAPKQNISLNNQVVIMDLFSPDMATTNEPVVGASLIIQKLNSDGSVEKTIDNNFLSDSNGNFNFSIAEPGTYLVSSFKIAEMQYDDGEINILSHNSAIIKVQTNTYQITTKVNNGTIDKTKNVDEGEKATINFKAKTGYQLKSITVDGKPIVLNDSHLNKSKTSYTFSDVVANHELVVTYQKINNVESTKENNKKDNTNNTENNKKKENDKTIDLPKTGNNNLNYFIIVSSLAVLFAGTRYCFKK